MRIVQEFFTDNIFKITGPDLLPEPLERVKLPERRERITVVVEPCVKDHQPVHEAFRISAVIRLPELELHKIERGKERLFIDSLLHFGKERVPDHLDHPVRILLLRILRDDRVKGLKDPVAQAPAYISADAGIEEGLPYRRSCRREKNGVKDAQSDDLPDILRISHDKVPGEICILILRLLIRDGVMVVNDLHFRKRFLEMDL